MSDESLDPRIDTLMAALYGELSESEERAFLRLLETDPALRAEWDELRGSRNLLAGWSVEETVPSFVLVGEQGAAPGTRGKAAAAGAGESRWTRFVQSLRGLGGAPAWGLAAAAVAIAALVISNARVNRVETRMAALLAQRQKPAATVMPGESQTAPASQAAPGLPLEIGSRPSAPGGSPLVQASGTYVTREDLDHNNDQLMGSIASVLNEYGQRRDQETLDLLQAMYERVNKQQLYDYRQLNGKLDDLGHELLLNRSLAEDKIEQLLGPAQPRDAAPTPEGGKDEKE